jgi:cysteinyl-tRNA synthetase
MKLHNSLTRQTEEFAPIAPPHVGMYTCGMTVYDYAHIGHGRKYVMDDVLRRTLSFNGYEVKHVQNVTDVGHLVSDSDDGDDKMEKGAAKANKTVWEVAQFFMDNFYESMDELNILRPSVICRATDHIPEQIALIEKLFKNGHAYETDEAVYFDVETFPSYGALLGQSLDEKKQAVREEVETGSHKRHPADFVLWFKTVGRFANHVMHWESPWGDGFPGWHLECSAMSMKYLGDQFDIHTGGEDHLPVHHPNEIAQSEGATNKHPFVMVWVHYSHLLVDGRKMSKSLGNFYTIEDVKSKGIDPLALRYFYLTAHYSKHMNFTWEALQAAQSALKSLQTVVQSLIKSEGEDHRSTLSPEKLTKIQHFSEAFLEAVNNDLNTPQALAVVWEMIKSNIPEEDKRDLLYSFDEVLGFNLRDIKPHQEASLSVHVQELVKIRDEARTAKDFAKADEVRAEIEKAGYEIVDSAEGTRLKPKM